MSTFSKTLHNSNKKKKKEPEDDSTTETDMADFPLFLNIEYWQIKMAYSKPTTWLKRHCSYKIVRNENNVTSINNVVSINLPKQCGTFGLIFLASPT